MRKKIVSLISLAISVALLYIVLKYVGISKVIYVFKTSRPSYLFLFLSISLFIILGLVYRWKRIIKANGYDVAYYKLFMYFMSGYAISYLTPSAKIGGEPVRAYLLHKEKIPFKEALSTVVLDKSIELSANLFYSIIGLIYILLDFALTTRLKYFLLGMIGFSAAVLCLFYSRLWRNKGLLTSFLRLTKLERIGFLRKNFGHIIKFEQGLADFFRKNKKESLIAFFISLVLWLATLLEYEILLLMFGLSNVSFKSLFLIMVFVGISYIFPVPAAIGILQLTQATLFKLIGENPGTGIAIGIAIQFRDLLWAIFGLVYVYFKGIKKFSSKVILKE